MDNNLYYGDIINFNTRNWTIAHLVERVVLKFSHRCTYFFMVLAPPAPQSVSAIITIHCSLSLGNLNVSANNRSTYVGKAAFNHCSCWWPKESMSKNIRRWPQGCHWWELSSKHHFQFSNDFRICLVAQSCFFFTSQQISHSMLFRSYFAVSDGF